MLQPAQSLVDLADQADTLETVYAILRGQIGKTRTKRARGTSEP